MRKRILVCMGILALTLTGCGQAAPKSTEGARAETVMQEAGSMAEKDSGGEDMEEEEDIKVVETSTKKVKSGGVEIQEKKKDQQLYQDGKPAEAENKQVDPELLQASLDALKSYFDITVDMKEYQPMISFFEGSGDEKANTSIYLHYSKGDEGFPPAATYNVMFFDSGELKAIYLMNAELVYGETDKMISLEDAKRIAKEFVVAKQLIPENEVKILGASVANDISISVIFEDGKDGALALQVGTKTGKVDCFDRLTKERGMKWITPVDPSDTVG